MGTALVVDDSRTIRMILRRVLAEENFEVLEAGNGREALQVLDASPAPVSLVLADWNMPEMNGLELVKQLRSRPEMSSVKVIMVTTEAETEHVVAALEAGANEYVMKPFTKEILKQKLEMIGVASAIA
jgi:two-component system chemotaxis response regulator CheY